MDTVFMSSLRQKSVSPNKQLRRYSSGAKQNENLAYNTSIIHGGGGLLFAPPPSLSFSYNPSAPLLNPLSYQNYQQQLQPPLLPLPSLSSNSNLKNNRNKDPKRSKSKSKQLTGKPIEEPKKRQLKPTKTQAVNKYKPFVMATAIPNDTPKVGKDLDKFTSCIFTLSPPPSSLPLPSFSLRPKLSCNAQAASVDIDGATDNLRRILRLP